MRNRIIIIVLLFFPWLSGTGSEAWKTKVSPAVLRQAAAEGRAECIVVLSGRADLSAAAALGKKEAKGAYVYERLLETARRTQVPVITLLRGRGAEYRAFWIVNAVWVRGDPALVEALAGLDAVERIVPNSSLVLEPAPALPAQAPDAQYPAAGPEWGLVTVQADAVWALGYKGQGAVIGGQDTGYEWDHPALKSQYRGWNGVSAAHDYNWHDAIWSGAGGSCGLSSPFPCDDSSHGTHTMGTMVGYDGDTNQVGMAPQARWIGCRNMDQGYGTPATYIECFEWFLAPTDLSGNNADPSKAPHVINNSWSCPPGEGCDSSNFALMETAIANLDAAGVVVVASAGNSGPGCSSIDAPPSIFEKSFSVGATRPDDSIASFSSRGQVTVYGSGTMKPDVSAPGVWVRSSVPGGGYSNSSGTSMAGPHVAGLVALVISANPALAGNTNEIKRIIRETAVAKTDTQSCGGAPGSQVPNNTFGWGRINALAAVQEAIRVGLAEPRPEGPSAAAYPNPFRTEIKIFLPQEFQIIKEVLIFDLRGRLMCRLPGINERFVVMQRQGLEKGMYLAEIRDSKGNAARIRVVAQ